MASLSYYLKENKFILILIANMGTCMPHNVVVKKTNCLFVVVLSVKLRLLDLGGKCLYLLGHF